jgi:hypothetical protein
VTSPTLRRLSLTKPVSSCPIRVGTGTDDFAASKADYEGGDYSPEAEAAVRAYERNRAELARQAEAAETAKPEREAEQRAIDDASAGSLPKSFWNDLGKLIIEAVQKLLGHESIQTTGDIYTDWDADQFAESLLEALQDE